MSHINDIYLCVDNNDLPASANWSCYKFNSYEDADDYFKIAHKENKNRTTLLPVCKYTPSHIVPVVLEWKLYGIFRSKISIEE